MISADNPATLSSRTKRCSLILLSTALQVSHQLCQPVRPCPATSSQNSLARPSRAERCLPFDQGKLFDQTSVLSQSDDQASPETCFQSSVGIQLEVTRPSSGAKPEADEAEEACREHDPGRRLGAGGRRQVDRACPNLHAERWDSAKSDAEQPMQPSTAVP
jgi:hypothetical protein